MDYTPRQPRGPEYTIAWMIALALVVLIVLVLG